MVDAVLQLPFVALSSNPPVKRETGAKAEIFGASPFSVNGPSNELRLVWWLESRLRSELITRDPEIVFLQSAARDGAHETMTVV
jgi:hypothetical protein